MISFESTLIETYRLATLPVRSAHRWWMTSQGAVPLGVLFYHRVADEFLTPWTITRRDFERQIDWLSKNFEMISLEECQRRMQTGNSKPALAITFDDGYAENCEWAIPLLLERKIPVTYFVVLDNIVNQRPFLHDLQFGNALPVNTVEQIQALAAAGIEVGGHTRSHPDLGTVTSIAELFDQVVAASTELGLLINRPIRYFAAPFGQLANLSPALFQVAREAGFAGVCSAYGGFNSVSGDSFHIKRIHGDPCFSRLRNWLQYDWRMLNVPDFAYEIPER